MKIKRLSATGLILLIAYFGLNAQIMTFMQLSGSQTSFNLNLVNNMTFSSGNFTIKSPTSTRSYPLTNFKNLKFSPGVLTTNVDQINENIINVFPNPFKNNLIVSVNEVIAQGANLSIFSIEGRLMKFQSILSSSITMDLSNLSSGLYFCTYFNGSEIKTLKIIKE